MTQIVPGWYSDPVDPQTQLRWWDGEKWTTHVYPRADAQPPNDVQAGSLEPSPLEPGPLESSPPESGSGDPNSVEPSSAGPGPVTGVDSAPGSLPTANPAASVSPAGPAQPPVSATPEPPVSTPPIYTPPGASGQLPTYGGYGPLSSRYVTHDGAQLAGWGSRFAARAIDFVLIMVAATVVAWPLVSEIGGEWVNYVQATVEATENQAEPPSRTEFQAAVSREVIQFNLIAFGLGLLYKVIFLRWRQATLGKMALGIKVRRVEFDGPLSLGIIARRLLGEYWMTIAGFLASILGLLGVIYRLLDYLWPLWDAKRQALHDRVANTQVVRRNRQ
jgi:uncharacterized RDD family membrane protein YckC